MTSAFPSYVAGQTGSHNRSLSVSYSGSPGDRAVRIPEGDSDCDPLRRVLFRTHCGRYNFEKWLLSVGRGLWKELSKTSPGECGW